MSQKIKTLFGKVEEISESKFLIKDFNRHSIGGIKYKNEYNFFLNSCPHANAPVCAGTVHPLVIAESNNRFAIDPNTLILRCPWHGMEFDLSDGIGIATKTLKLVKIEYCLEEGNIYIFI